MDFIAIEAPASRVTTARELAEFRDAALGIVAPGYFLEVIADHLIEALAEGASFLAGALRKLLVD
jgi:hypothetical protein